MKHTRGLALILVLAVLLAAACDLSSMPYKPGSSGESVEWHNPDIHIVVDQSAEFVRQDLTEAAAKWSKSKYVDVTILPAGEPCPTGLICPVMWGYNPGTEAVRMAWGVCTWCRFFEDYGRVDARFDVRWAPGPTRKNGVCHEMGHGLGLDHGNVPGPCQNAVPTAWDIAVVDAIHDPKDL